MIDKTIIQIASIIVASTGLFAVLTKYHSPEAKSAFYSDNLFILKKESIDKKLIVCYTLWTLTGLLIQWVSITFYSEMVIRKHTTHLYITFTCILIVFSCTVLFVLYKIGYRLAKSRWRPTAIKRQKDIFLRVKYILDHEGYGEDQYAKRDEITNSDKCKEENYKIVDEKLKIMAKLFDINLKSCERSERIDQISSIFK